MSQRLTRMKRTVTKLRHFCMTPETLRRGVIGGMLGCLLLFAGTAPALAFLGVGDVSMTTVTADVPRQIKQVQDSISSQLLAAAISAVMNALQTFAGQVAYDAATYIASGGKGQGTAFYNKSFGDYLTNVASDAAGSFISSLSSSEFFKGLGVDLCKPKSPNLMLNIQLGLTYSLPNLPNAPSRPKPNCNLQDVISNYQNLYQTLSNTSALNTIRQSFDPGSSDLGTMSSIFQRMTSQTQSQVAAQGANRAEGGGFQAVTNPITGDIRTPSAVVSQTTNTYIVQHPKDTESQRNLGMLVNAAQQGPIQILTYSLSIFTDTLISQSLKRIFEQGLSTPPAVLTSGQANVNPDDLFTPGATDARQANIAIAATPPISVSDIELISDMENCPTEARGTWNCVMDAGLVQALTVQENQSSLTIAEALKSNLLHASWPLIPETDPRNNRDAGCYNRAYCAGNLQKLRLARVFPAGVEFAANSVENQQRCKSSCATLGEVVNGFFVCNDAGQRDADHPWCHLVDPSWVLVSIPQKCALTGYSDTLQSAGLPQRAQECEDVQTCLKRDNNGTCTGGYGYCMAEKTVYRFQGDVCPMQFASCQTYKTSKNQTVSYLRNTLDSATCSESNAGCLWYATERDAMTGNWKGSVTTGTRAYFTNAVAPCDGSQNGCTKLYQVNFGSPALNLVLNSSFEDTTTTNPRSYCAPGARGCVIRMSIAPMTVPTLWTQPLDTLSTPITLATTTTALDGTYSLRFPDTARNMVHQMISLAPSRSYTLSASIKAGAAVIPDVHLALIQYQDVGATIPVAPSTLNTLFHSPNCTTVSTSDFDRNGIILAPRPAGSDGVSPDGSFADWQRIQCSFLTSSSTVMGDLVLSGSGGAFIDAVQLEESDFATQYMDGVNSNLTPAYMKVPSDDLACTGAATDSPLCSNFAKVCRQKDAGCDSYTDVDGGGSIPAIYTTADVCPAACVGYAEYQKAPSAFDLVRNTDIRLNDNEEPTGTGGYYFIGSTAQTCSQQQVGCESFTDVSTSTAGATQPYSYLRLCERPSDHSKTYFTWEGSDTTGYQLKTWSLVASSTEVAAPPKIIIRPGPDGALKDPSTCNADTWHLATDTDCRQLYDSSGNVFYIFMTQTVLSTATCIPEELTNVHVDDCVKTGGDFHSGSCVYNASPSDSRVCSVTSVGCRAFLGSGAGNLQSVLTEDFSHVPNTFDGGVQSTESVQVGGFSLRLNASSGSAHTNVVFPSNAADAYRVSFWAKVSGQPTAGLNFDVSAQAASGAGVYAGSVTLNSDWQRFVVGPFKGVPHDVNSQLNWRVDFGTGSGAVFISQVNIEHIHDIAYVVNDSWKTPAECDQNQLGVPEPQAMLGCRAYTNHAGQTAYAYQFSHLCSEAAIACTAYVDTRNSDQVGAHTFQEPLPADSPSTATSTLVAGEWALPATIVRPAMRYIYLIDDPAMHCVSDNASCRAFGLPNEDPTRQHLNASQPYSTVYLKDDITQYSQTMCKPSELYCNAFSSNGTKNYFRDPGIHACEYRTGVSVTGLGTVPDGQYDGWFQVGANVPCYANILQSGQTFGIARNGDGASYQGWGAVCPAAQNACTEFRDPNDKSDPLHPEGKPYDFLRNDNLDTSSCGGNSDPGSGCILLRDTSDQTLTFSTHATYASYAANFSHPVSPVNCDQNPGNPSCVVPGGHCAGTITFYTGCGADHVTGCTVHGGGDLVGVLNGTTAPFSGSVPAFVGATSTLESCSLNSDCTDTTSTAWDASATYSYKRTGQCLNTEGLPTANDANLLIKVSTDRDCAQWLGCSSSESVFDTTSNKYRDVCTNLALCYQASGNENDIYCGHYVDRSTTSTSPVLTRGAYFDIDRYSNRPVGLGTYDYSGYSIPNAFSALDIQTEKVAVDGIPGSGGTSPNQFSHALDYRLAATADIPRHVGSDGTTCVFDVPKSNQAEILCNASEVDPSKCAFERPTVSSLATANPSLSLCKQIGSGIVGYYMKDKTGFVAGCPPVQCFLPVRGNMTKTDFPSLSQGFANPDSNADLKSAFPPAECRANPEADSPFGAEFVTQWDMTKNPVQTIARLGGYESANTCEYGEDCTCSYKRVSYQNDASSKFYGVNSEAVAPGICFGGPRSGQSCEPGTIYKPPATTPTATTPPASGTTPPTQTQTFDAAAAAANATQTCGDPSAGGTCVAAGKIQLIRGIFGQCLERDTTRNMGANQDQTPCLTWNPTPILFGDKDVYHYSPTAGYMPPQNSGQYYCLSHARPSRSLTLDSTDFTKSGGTYAGSMSLLYYDKFHLKDGHDFNGCYLGCGDSNLPGASLDGVLPDGGVPAARCQDAARIETAPNGDDPDQDFKALRLVTTGRGEDKSYTEAFFPINASTTGQFIENSTGSPTNPIGDSYDSHIGFFNVLPIAPRNITGRLGCGYNPEWVDGKTTPGDWKDSDSVTTAESNWRQGFYGNLPDSTINRGSETILTVPNGGQPVLGSCVHTLTMADGSTGDADWNRCYFKTWQLNYRTDGLTAGTDFFKGIFNSGQTAVVGDVGSLQTSPYYSTCSSATPYFSIRAVFQAKADTQSFSSDSAAGHAGDIHGPWRFVGFWVSTCGGHTNYEHFIYTYVTMYIADACTQLAEVKSVKSNQDAAFTDRVWSQGNFTLPVLGFQYGARFSPFASELNTASAELSKTPLFQTGQAIAGYSPLNPPVFLGSSQNTYYNSASTAPKNQWAYLSNLFARIYRIYKLYDTPVSVKDRVCLSGPDRGKRCVPNNWALAGAPDAPLVTSSTDCGAVGVCSPTADLPANLFCNSLSGINSGLSCDTDPAKCHLGLVEPSSGLQLQTSCEIRPSLSSLWTLLPDGGWQGPELYYAPGASSVLGPVGTLGCSAGYTAGSDSHCAASNCIHPYGTTYSFGASTPFTVCGDSSNTHVVMTEYSQTDAARLHVFGCHVLHGVNSPTYTGTWVSGDLRVSPRGDEGSSRVYTGDDCSQPTDTTPNDSDLNSLQHPSLECPLGTVRNAIMSADPLLTSGSATTDDPTGIIGPQDAYSPGNDETGCVVDPPSPDRRIAGYCHIVLPNGSFVNTNTIANYPPCFENKDCEYTMENYWYKPASGSTASTVPPAIPAERPVGSPLGSVNVVSLTPMTFPTTPPTVRTCLSSSECGRGSSCIGFVLSCTDVPATRDTPSYRSCVSRGHCSGGVSTVGDPTELSRFPGTAPASTDGTGFYNVAQCASLVPGPSPEIPALSAYQTTDFQTNIAQSGVCTGGSNDGNTCLLTRTSFPWQAGWPGIGTATWSNSSLSCGQVEVPDPHDSDCGAVSVQTGSTEAPIYTPACYDSSGNSIPCGSGSTPFESCFKNGTTLGPTSPTAVLNPDDATSNNTCIHGTGYRPDTGICPDPTDEFCGLIGYDLSDSRRDASLNPGPDGAYPMPTDVTMGYYTPAFLGSATVTDSAYAAYYTPTPPRIAAPDVVNCSVPGQCPILHYGSFAFDGQYEGALNATGGQTKATMRFYAWAAHNQMPLRKLSIDWGDGRTQDLPDAKLANHKPFCGGTNECWSPGLGGATGLTCQTDSDCPPGLGQCRPVGTCGRRDFVQCTNDADCTQNVGGRIVKDTCNVRPFFGNSADACQADYFEFDHLYTCQGPTAGMPACDAATPTYSVPVGMCYYTSPDDYAVFGGVGGIARTPCSSLSPDPEGDCASRGTASGDHITSATSGVHCNLSGSSLSFPIPGSTVGLHCSGDPARACVDASGCAPGDTCIAGLAPPGGCWDATSQQCRYTPRLFLEDNWGWCTGECRTALDSRGSPVDPTNSAGNVISPVIHKYGGCYAGGTIGNTHPDIPNVRPNDNSSPLISLISKDECSSNDLPMDSDPAYINLRPWIVYPGSLNLRVLTR